MKRKNNRLWVLLGICWTIVIGSFAWQESNSNRNDIVEFASVEARASFNKDLVYRRWAASHGGVYVPATVETPPNVYLNNVLERDIETPSGRKLTLVNPAYMTRQVHDLAEAQYGVKGHITSLNPIRPENKPDSWETEALLSFEAGKASARGESSLGSESYLRMMFPMEVEEGCLTCHEEQGYHLGDVRGGVSVSVPLKPYLDVYQAALPKQMAYHAGLWLLGIIGLLLARRMINKQFLVAESVKYLLEKAQQLGCIGSWELDIGKDLLVWTDENCRIFGVPSGSVVNYEVFAKKIHPEDREYVDQEWSAAMQGIPYDIEHRIVIAGETRWVREKADITFDLNGRAVSAIGFTQDITERKLVEEELRQSQKIESLGRLAGGVAHDYNNMLSVIIGNVELAQMKAERSAPLNDNLVNVLDAANRSRDITRQLLAFARKQTIKPKVFDLNVAIENMLKMLRTLLGEDIDLVLHPKEGSWLVKIDPSQLDQILANLCINSRDAIADVGKMTIETDTVSVDEDYCKDHPGFIFGNYVVLSVSDNGCGMDKETLDHVFEPFFTTKSAGEGTGLGLATVYGIVKQSGGFINAYSETDQGTTFKIYLPRYEGEDVVSQARTLSEVQKGLGETVLLVEDEVAIVELTTAMLEDLGYKVLAANSPAEALTLVKEFQGVIQLLLTDVVMPGMNGLELTKQIMETRPTIKTLYMSGYTADIIGHHGVLDVGINFIQKPFSRSDLSIRVREILDSHA